MSNKIDPNRVPASMIYIYHTLADLIGEYASHYLTNEYAALARRMVATLARKRPSPLRSGSLETWACGVLYTLGKINFLCMSTSGRRDRTAAMAGR